MAKETEGAIKILHPEELARVMAAAKAALVLFLAIGAFAGLRHAEMQRPDCSEVRLEDGLIEAKASRRLVPTSELLKRWLARHQQPHGKVCPYASMLKQLLWLAESEHAEQQKETPSGRFAWKHNSLRHSFCSYRLAEVKSAAQVAFEAENSPQMICQHCRELVTEDEAKAWFGIGPKAANNVTALSKARGKAA